jgi:hypothetical protein
MRPPHITLHSHWRGKRTPIKVEVTRITVSTVSYIGVHSSISGTVPQWQFLQSFQPVVTQRKKKGRRPA